VSKPGRNNRFGCALYTLNVHSFKNDTWSRLMLEHEGPGYCHWPVEEGRGYDADYFSGFLSERLLKKQVAGRWTQRWYKVKEHARNEPWDCRVYATAALHLLAPDPSILDQLIDQAKAGGGSWAPPATSPRGRRMGSRGVTI
jgi:phage terminase large subunit GpA-like protein